MKEIYTLPTALRSKLGHLLILVSIVLHLSGSSLWGGLGFVISKSVDEATEVTRAVCLKRQQIHKPLSEFKEELFPASDKEDCVLFIDLKGLTSADLYRVDQFLSGLTTWTDIVEHVVVLQLQNGTSFKFNRIFKGIKSYFEKATARAKVIYMHEGNQSPAFPQKKLSTLGTVEILSPVQDILKKLSPKYSDPPSSQKIRFTLSPTDSADSYGFIVDLVEGEERIKASSGKSLHEVLDKDERQCRLAALKKQWTETLKQEEWPPLGLTRKDELLFLHPHDLSEVDCSKLPPSPLVLHLSGLLPGDALLVPRLCRQLPSLKCIRVENSRCNPTDFRDFCASSPPSDKDLLGPAHIKFFDVQTTFHMNEEAIRNLHECVTSSGHKTSFDYFVYMMNGTESSDAFRSLSEESQATHRLFWIIEEYIKLLQ